MLKFGSLPAHWQRPLSALLILTLVFGLSFRESWQSIVDIWSRSDTFAHGYLVLPASLWLIMTRRDLYVKLRPTPSYLGITMLLACGFGWLVAEITGVLVVEQFALVGMLVCLIWSVLGTQVAGSMLFPLFFLFLMVPFGEDFVPFLMEYTASFVVFMLRLTGISVYREGLHFTLTSGNWSVIEACSGIRYLIASITLGLLYAYLNYTRYVKRLIFILASILVPILANGLRAYMIVMIGHLSDMKLATGVDHIIYGWLFFGLVMLLLFYIGSFWQDQSAGDADQTEAGEIILVSPKSHILLTGAITFIGIAMWPLAATELHARQSIKASIPAALLQNLPVEAGAAPVWSWEPLFKGVMAAEKRSVGADGQVVGIYFANFGDESQGGELINSQNTLISKDQLGWKIIDDSLRSMDWPAQPTKVEEVVITNGQQYLLVLRWYRIGQTNTANRYYAKWLQLLKRLSGDASPEVMAVLYTQTPHGDYRQARDRLQKIALACCE